MITEKEKNFVSAVVYFHNNASTAAESIRLLYAVLGKSFESFEIICVDDGSGDGTPEVIRNAVPADSGCALTIVKMSRFQGCEAAMSAGTNLSIGDYVFEFDSSVFSFPEDMILQVYRKAQEGFDIVSAVDKSYKKLSSRFFYNIFNKGANLTNPIQSESFRILSRRALNRVYAMGKFVKYRKALYANCGFKQASIRYTGTQKHAAGDKSEKGYRTETAITSMILFTDTAYKLSVTFSLLMMAATILIAVYTLVVFLAGNPVEGFATTMLVMSGSFFAVFLLFAIVIKYLSVLVQLVFNEQEYMIESIEKISK